MLNKSVDDQDNVFDTGLYRCNDTLSYDMIHIAISVPRMAVMIH